MKNIFLFFIFIQIINPLAIAQVTKNTEGKDNSTKIEEISQNKENKSNDISSTEKIEENNNNIFKLGEIVVKGKSLHTIEDAATTSVVTQKDIKAHSDKTLDDSLKLIPGVIVEEHQKGYKRALIRGFDMDTIAILVDGIPVADIYSSDIDLSNIFVMNVSKIVVNKGVSSALYGTAGPIGFINVITKQPQEFFAETKAEIGQFGNDTLNAAVGGPIGNFYCWFTGSFINSNGYELSSKLTKEKRREWFDKFIRYDLYGYSFDQVNIPAKNDYINDTGKWDNAYSRKYDFSGKMGYNFSPSTETGISYMYNYFTGQTNTYQVNAYSTFSPSNGTWQDPVFTVTGTDDTTIKKAALRNRSFEWPDIYSYRIAPYLYYEAERLTVKTTAYFTYKQSDQVGYSSTEHSFPKDQAVNSNFFEPYKDIQTYTTYGINLYPSYRIAGWNKLSFAGLWRKDIFKDENQAIGSSSDIAKYLGDDPFPMMYLEASNLTLAVEEEMNLFKGKVNITAGISYDSQFFEKFKNRDGLYTYHDVYVVKDDSMIAGTRDSFNPVAGILYNAIDNFLILRTSGSIKTRFPLLSEYAKVVDAGYDYNLKSERSYNLNAGFEFIIFDKALSIRSDYFSDTVTNKIVKISGSGKEPPVNIDKKKVLGTENSVNYSSKNILGIFDINMRLSYTYLRVRLENDSVEDELVNKGKFLELTPEHQITADLQLRFKAGTSLDIWGYSTIKQIMYAMDSRPASNASFSTGYYKAVRVHDPVFLNIKISQRVFDFLDVYVMCKNILDDYDADPFNPGPGRMFFAGAAAKL